MIRRTHRKDAAPSLPQVNLLSPWVFDALAVRTLRRRFLVAAGALSLVVAAAWAVQLLRADQAEQVLAIEQAESARLTAEVRDLAPVRAYVTAVEMNKQTVSTAMRDEVRYSEVLGEVAQTTPADADVESIAVTLAAPAAAAAGSAPASTSSTTGSVCPGPDPFRTKEVVGCITLAGSADSRDAVGRLVVALGRSRLFVEPFISTTTTADGEKVTFTGSVGMAERVFTRRYVDLDMLLDTKRIR